MSDIFKACDIRGHAGPDLSPEVARRIGRAVGSLRAGQTVAVAGDLRESTPALKAALIEGLAATGADVVDLGTLPTPAFYFGKEHLGCAGGVMVTGSHNPPGDNGFKVSLGAGAITPADIQEIRRRAGSGDFAAGSGTVRSADVLPAYEAFLRGHFPRVTRGARLVVDAGNGCYGPIAPRVLRDRGHDVVELYCDPDGRFPNRPPDPAVAANLRVLGATVVRERAALGVAYDGDGDRVVFVDPRGRVVESDVACVIFARHVLAARPGDVVHDIKCSGVVAEEVRRAGGTPVMEKSGHAFIRGTLLRRRAVFGGEISGHFFFGELGRDDGLYATLLMLDILRAAGRDLAALSDEVPRYVITPDLRLPAPPDRARAILDAMGRAFAGEAGCEVSTLDGVRVAWPDGWALARSSVTEPLLTMRFEARTQARLDDIKRTVVDRVPALKEIMR